LSEDCYNVTIPDRVCMFFCGIVRTVDRKENIDSVLQREYTIENVLGTGGFGTVYSGIRKRDSKAVS